MRNLLIAAVVALMASAVNADVTISANGFPVNHPGNGTFTLKQVMNPATGKPIDCWSQNNDNNGWVASYSASGEILTVTYCRHGFPHAVYRIMGTTLSAQNIGLSTSTVSRQVPASVSFSP
jgi:opacity protein-like surface antigen